MYVHFLFIFKISTQDIVCSIHFRIFPDMLFVFYTNIAHFSNHCISCQQTEEKKNSGTRCFFNEKYNNFMKRKF